MSTRLGPKDEHLVIQIPVGSPCLSILPNRNKNHIGRSYVVRALRPLEMSAQITRLPENLINSLNFSE